MPVATPEQYAEMLDKAKTKGFAYPAVNVSSSSTINAVLQGLDRGRQSDGIIQVTTGGADYFAGQTVKNRASGALAFAAFATEVAKNYPVTVALHTDHCPKDALDGFVLPAHRRIGGGGQGGAQPDLPVAHVGRLVRAARREPRDREDAAAAHESDQRDPRGRDRRGRRRRRRRQPRRSTSTSTRRSDDAIKLVDALGLGDHGRYMAALTFGNVHGVYKPGNVKLRPELLGEIQDGLAEEVRHDGASARPRLPRRLGLLGCRNRRRPSRTAS